MDLAASPLAPARTHVPPPVEGVRFAVAEAGIKYAGRADLMLAVFDPGTVVAGVLTRSTCASAPVEWCRERLGRGTARALVVNSGNANAFTGVKGRRAAEITAGIAATVAGCAPDEVFLASTGVIGEPLDPEKFRGALAGMAGRLAPGPLLEPARAIMTTDTYPKLASATVEIDGIAVTVSGIAKGSGMIAPDMATMLAFVFTDMPVTAPVLQTLVARHNATSFNAITVDGDTSTSDTCLVFATGRAAARGLAPLADPDDPRSDAFGTALAKVMFDLAMQIVRDGEGATKFVEVTVTGAVSNDSALSIARSIANSPLVKTAIAGEDANWGRIVMAVGKAGEPADRDRLSIRFGGVVVARDGERSPDYDEAAASATMREKEIAIGVDLGLGSGAATVYTCDLTHGYISINADYRS